MPEQASWRRTSSGRGWVTPSRSWTSRPSAPTDRGPTSIRSVRSTAVETRSDRPVSTASPGPVRRARTNPTGSVRRRRAAKARACSLARSVHCTSSTATTTGPSADRMRRTSATASPTRLGSGRWRPGLTRPMAVSRACRRGSGTRSRSGTSIGSSKSAVSAAKASSRSALLARQASTRSPRSAARSTAYDHSVLLPMPASPLMSSDAGRFASSHASIARRSASRPTTTAPAVGCASTHRW